MKKVIKKGLIITGIAIGVVATGVQIQSFQKEIAIRQNEAETDAHIAAKRAALDKETVPNIEAGQVMEDFKIIEITPNGYARGEKTEGTGEGIYYSLDTFKQYGVSDVKVGDVVEVTLPIDAYENNDWDKVKNMMRIDSNN